VSTSPFFAGFPRGAGNSPFQGEEKISFSPFPPVIRDSSPPPFRYLSFGEKQKNSLPLFAFGGRSSPLWKRTSVPLFFFFFFPCRPAIVTVEQALLFFEIQPDAILRLRRVPFFLSLPLFQQEVALSFFSPWEKPNTRARKSTFSFSFGQRSFLPLFNRCHR